MQPNSSVLRIAVQLIIVITLAMAPGLGNAKSAVPPPCGAFGLDGFRVAKQNDNSSGTMRYTDAAGKPRTTKWYGATWSLQANYPDNAARDAAAAGVLNAVAQNGGMVFHRQDGLCLAMVTDREQPDRRIYLELGFSRNKTASLDIHAERKLTPGVAVEVDFDPAKADMPKEIVFRSDFDGSHYYTVDIEILMGQGVTVVVQNDLDDTPFDIRHKSRMVADSKYYRKYGMYDLDPYRAPHTFQVEPLSRKAPVRARLTLRKSSFKITPLGELSAKPGVFKLKNALAELPKLSPLGNVGNDYDPTGDLLPDGDAVYWLSNAYYSFEINKMRTNLTPVLSSHQTTVEWPLALAEMKPKATGRRGAASRMAVYGVKPLDGGLASVDISLSNLPKGLEPAKEDFVVFEAGGIAGEVRSVERLPEPINLVILLDSSGSMKKSMGQAIASVEAFINLLPADANITLVDFDTKVKPVQSKDRAELLAKLRQVRADGATALYDSVIEAQAILRGKSRASVVLFTDGRDANYNDTARGSRATFNQMMQSVQASNVPIYPIAFGDKADTATLQAMAKLTKTAYYQGDSPDALANIFADIAGDLSSAYRVTFARGRRGSTGSQPVVNFMVDVSASMDLRFTMNKDCEGCGYRLENLKEMLAKSVLGLGDDTYMQLSSFNSDVRTLQVITRDKAKMLAGIGAIKIGGGTNIVEAVKQSLALSQVIPSDRRYLVFVTDAAGGAFEFEEDEQKSLDANLMALKEAGVQCFWLGMWESPQVVAELGKLARLSGGEVFVSSNTDKIRDKVLELTERIKQDQAGMAGGGNTVEVRFNHRDAKTGEILAAVGQKRVEMPVLVSDQVTQVSDVSCTIEPMDVDRQSYNQASAAEIYGDDKPLEEARVSKIIPLVDRQGDPVAAENKAMRLAVSKAVIMDRLKGIGSRHGRQFLVLDLDLANILPSQEVVVLDDGANHPSSWLSMSDSRKPKTIQAIPTYRIPGLKNHLFIRVNNGHEVAFHPITWALEQPLAEIGAGSLDIPGGGHKSGVLAFDIPSANITALSLHFYDTSYGHIDLPLIGTMETTSKDLAALPQKAPEKLSDAFALRAVARDFLAELMGAQAPAGSVFEVLELELDSQVNALLKFEPSQRFSLHIKSPLGRWVIPVHEITARAPLGIYGGLSLAPGSHNRFALVFQVPEALKDAPQELVVELRGQDKRIAITDMAAPASGSAGLARAGADAISLDINAVALTKEIDGRKRKRLLVDLTIDDEEDGSATRLGQFLALADAPKQNFLGRSTKPKQGGPASKGMGGFANAGTDAEDSRKFVFADSDSRDRLLGCAKVVKDGTKTRCVLLFDPDKVKTKGEVYLISPVFTDLALKLDLAKLPQLKDEDSYLTVGKLEIKDRDGDKRLDELLARVRQEKLIQAKLDRAKVKKAYSLDDGKELASDVDPLPVSFSGGLVTADIKDFDAAVKALAGLAWVPAGYDKPLYSAQAMLTQGWGTEYDMQAWLASFVRRMNAEVEAGAYPLTKAGFDALTARAGGVPLTLKQAPYLRWQKDGAVHDIVLPFFKPAAELAGMIDTSPDRPAKPARGLEGLVKLTLYYDNAPGAGATAQIGSVGSALGGASGRKKEQKLALLTKSYSLPEACNMPMDFWFAQGKDQRGDDIIRTYAYGPQGVDSSDGKPKGGIIPRRLVVELGDPGGRLEPFTFAFKEDQELKDVFITLSLAAPDLPPKALADLHREQQVRLANNDKLSDFSRLQWANRAKIYAFIGLQTRREQDLKTGLKLAAARNRTPRVIMAVIERTPDGGLVSSLDLCRVAADVHGSDKAVKAYLAGSGIFNAQAEAAVTPGAPSLMDQWFKVEGQKVLVVMPGKKQNAIKMLQDNGADDATIARLQKSKKVWLYPLKNGGKPIWLEVDPQTYATVSMLPGGMHGAMAENRIIDTLIREGVMYAAGFFAGMDTSLLTVVAVSMYTVNYDEILRRAEAIASFVACGVSTLSSAAGLDVGKSASQVASGGIDIGLGVASCFNGDAARKAGLAKGMGFSMAGGDFTGDGVKSLLGFANGFGDAVTLYFTVAKDTAHQP